MEKAVIITEGVFSMDGDIPPLNELADLAETHDALLCSNVKKRAPDNFTPSIMDAWLR